MSIHGNEIEIGEKHGILAKTLHLSVELKVKSLTLKMN